MSEVRSASLRWSVGDFANTANLSHDTLAKNHRRRLEAGITTRIKQLQYFRQQLHLIDEKIFSAGMDLFESAPILANWLCDPPRPSAARCR